jgi:WD40 repeat protein
MPTQSVGDYERQIVEVWDLSTGNKLGMGTQTAHTNSIAGLAFAPDGHRLATASHDGTVKLWEVGTWRELNSLRAESISGRQAPRGQSAADEFRESRRFDSVAFSPDGTSLVAGLKDGTIVSWELATWREQYVRRGHGATVYGLAFSPDGRTLASGGWDRLVKLWDARTGRELRALSGHGDWVMGVEFTPDGRTLASFDSGGMLRPWHAPLGRERNDRNLRVAPGSVDVRSAENNPAAVPSPEAPRR